MDAAVKNDIQAAAKALKQGLLIAYPTEAVYGLGCDPMQPEAVDSLIKLKKRQPDKGLILIASSFAQLKPYIADIKDELASRARATWPGPVTWVWPVNTTTTLSPLLTGKHKSIAVRVTNHPVAAAICEAFQGTIVSTSANLEGAVPATTAQQTRDVFQNQLAVIVDAPVGDLAQPTKIYDVLTQATLR